MATPALLMDETITAREIAAVIARDTFRRAEAREPRRCPVECEARVDEKKS